MSKVFELFGRILIDHKDADTTIHNTTQKAKDLGDALEGAGTSADTAAKNLGEQSSFNAAAVWMGNTLYKLTEKAVELGLNIGKLGFNYDADMESYKIAFTTMMNGNSEAAGQLIDQLRDLGAATPMNTAGLVKNAKTMMGFGIAADDVIDTLTMLGDAAQGNQASLDSLVLAYSQMMAAGQLYAQDAYQMTNAGFPIWKMLSENEDMEISVLRKMAEKGEVTTDMVTNAFKYATEEGGLFYEAMMNQSETFNGKMSTLQDNAEMVAGGLMQSFFDVAKSDVLPNLTKSLEAFGLWATENQDLLKGMAEAAGKFASISFEAVLDCVKWLTENGEATAAAIGAIATSMAVAAVAAHPYAAAVTAVVAALAYLNSESGKKRGEFTHVFDGYTDDQLQTLQRYVDAVNEAKRAEEAYAQTLDDADYGALQSAWEKQDAAFAEARAIDGLIDAYNRYSEAQGANGGNDMYIDVPLRVDDESEGEMQQTIDGMSLESIVKLVGDTSGLQAAVNAVGLSASVRIGGYTSEQPDGSHASGLDSVPRDGYMARLHKGEAVLTSAQANEWRGGSGRIEALLAQLVGIMSAGQSIQLDSGVLVGQLAPAMDAQLGTIASRKRRGS